jgi:hypothetical protein
MGMTGGKVYLQPMDTVMNAILDIQELQNGKTTYADTRNGKLHFAVEMYASMWEFRFTVTDIGNNRCRVDLEVNGDLRNKQRQIMREFSLLHSMLVGEAEIEIIEGCGM